ncbi:MAG: hypothetical protein EBR27_12795, partial [Betaproteobacteria bacterium]|nr:hypothetical protein [Betaproteobacteria bacterium]
MKRQVKVFIEGQELDLFDDEQIQVSSSVQNIKSYTITFYGKLVSLKDLFGEDKLMDLDHSSYSHDFTFTEVMGRIYGTNLNTNVQYPLISSNRLWEYVGFSANYTFPNWVASTITGNNINTTGGAINVLTEL